jgi:hypothetical protein
MRDQMSYYNVSIVLNQLSHCLHQGKLDYYIIQLPLECTNELPPHVAAFWQAFTQPMSGGAGGRAAGGGRAASSCRWVVCGLRRAVHDYERAGAGVRAAPALG